MLASPSPLYTSTRKAQISPMIILLPLKLFKTGNNFHTLTQTSTSRPTKELSAAVRVCSTTQPKTSSLLRLTLIYQSAHAPTSKTTSPCYSDFQSESAHQTAHLISPAATLTPTLLTSKSQSKSNFHMLHAKCPKV